MAEKPYTVQYAQAAVSVEEYLAHCVDVPKFLACCKECANYGARWGCPPFDFEVRELWEKYKTLRLYVRFLIPGGCATEDLMAALWVEKESFLTELLALERAHPGSLFLSCGGCTICEACTRGDGQPCRHPELVRPSLEALGGDVGKTAERYFGKPLLWIKDGAAPDYLMLVGGLLLREEL